MPPIKAVQNRYNSPTHFCYGADWTGYEGRNEMRFMNHSDDPNAEMDGLYCYAVRDIALGCEITIDYGWNDS